MYYIKVVGKSWYFHKRKRDSKKSTYVLLNIKVGAASFTKEEADKIIQSTQENNLGYKLELEPVK